MNTEDRNTAMSWLWKIPSIAVAYFGGVMIAGGVVTAAKMQWPAVPSSASESENTVLALAGSILMAGSLALLARGIRGSQVVRWLILVAFSYVTFGLNNQIEAAIFTTFGGTATMLLFFVLPCAFGAAAAVWLARPEQSNPPLATVITVKSASTWWWRVAVAWLAFPAIYIIFGMLVAPFVVPVYEGAEFGLKLPGWGTLLPVALGRSALYLAVTVPILLSWSRSRRSLILSLGIAFFAMMGLIGLLTTTFFPPILRIAHSIEIFGDGMVYAWLLVALFLPKTRSETTEPVPAAPEFERHQETAVERN
jgi:hypothetical protein